MRNMRPSLWSQQNQREAADTRSADRFSELRLEKLALLCRAMWSLLQERTGLTEEDLARRAVEIDLLDGKADGRVSVPASSCTACGRILAARHTRCVYCGAEKLVSTLFETV